MSFVSRKENDVCDIFSSLDKRNFLFCRENNGLFPFYLLRELWFLPEVRKNDLPWVVYVGYTLDRDTKQIYEVVGVSMGLFDTSFEKFGESLLT